MDIGSTPPRPIQFDAVADIYDAYVRTEFDIPFWLSECGSVGGKVLELTCGTGRISLPLLKAGVDLTCVDYAQGMLARFRQKLAENGLTCRVICQDIAELDLPDQFSLIFIPFHSFSEILEEEKRRAALRRIRARLAPRGTFICTLQNPAVRTASMNGSPALVGEFAMDKGKLVVSSRFTYNPSTQLARGEQMYDHVAPDGLLIDHRTLEVCFYLFRKEEFEALVDEAGFRIVELYGDYDRSPYDEHTSPFMIWKLA